ncbi:MAG: Flp1 family type IVb pilin [Catonella sp.]|uniref:Flp1 family type IVb pilin n=1 Tax=Catonella sp. TaxID=2382125 RepID=UPI003FA0CD78
MRVLGEIKQRAKDFCYGFEVKKMLAKDRIKEIQEDNRGIAVIEIILILVIVLGLVLIFRNNLKTMIDEIFSKIKGNQKKIVAPLS